MNVTVTMNGTDDVMAAMVPAWVIIFDNIQLSVTIVGVIANSMTLITLIKNSDGFSDIVSLLLKYQSALDAIVSLFAFLLIILPPFWKVGNSTMDAIICQLWHGTYLYWVTISMSIWNLVTLAVERYICICHPLRYTLITKTNMRFMILVCFLLSVVFPFGAMFGTRMRGDMCVSEFFWDGPEMEMFMAIFAVSTFFTFYAIPSVMFVILYGLIIYQFKQRAKASLGASGTANVIDKASSELTKTAIVVTIIFIIAYSWDLWYYMLGYIGVTEYIINSPMMKIGIFLAVINSVVNPFVYASLMPVYRRSVLKTFCCWKAT